MKSFNLFSVLLLNHSVIGRFNNEVNAIRTGFMSSNVAIQLEEPNILSSMYWVPITVRLSRIGTLSLSITGQSDPFLSHDFSQPLNIQWISFA